VDVTVRIGAIVLLATPPFVVGLLLLLVVALHFHAAPTGGWAGNFLGDWAYLWLPVLALAAHLLPTLVMVVRESILETAGLHFIEAALSRGIAPMRVLFVHVLKNSLLPLITVVALNLGGLIGGAIVIETIFSLPGVGSLLVTSVFVRDYPVVQAVVIVTAFATVLANFGADALYRVVDPRTKGSAS
jgi:peptide/nickel transport system permease protein